MIVCETSNIVIYLKLLLLYITSANTLSQSLGNTTKSINTTKNNGSTIPVEGGGKLILQPTNVTIIPGPNLDKALLNFKLPNRINTNVSVAPSTSVVLEGGDRLNEAHPELTKSVAANNSTHTADHNNHINEHPSIVPSPNISNSKVESTVMEGGGNPEPNHFKGMKSQEGIPKKPIDDIQPPQRTIPVSEAGESSRQKIAPRKGVNNLEYAEFKKLATNKTDIVIPKPIVKKPLLTEASHERHNAKNSEINIETNSTLPNDTQSKVPSLDRFKKFSNNTQQYVVPIVIVILSVPLVTIVISFLLKRGTEWWKYRHYRRMDFLINGIYDT